MKITVQFNQQPDFEDDFYYKLKVKFKSEYAFVRFFFQRLIVFENYFDL